MCYLTILKIIQKPKITSMAVLKTINVIFSVLIKRFNAILDLWE